MNKKELVEKLDDVMLLTQDLESATREIHNLAKDLRDMIESIDPDAFQFEDKPEEGEKE